VKARLALADGLVLEGTSFGAAGDAGGEVVFNTSLAGYQEILTDPSYAGQIVTMTYPLIGNYGVNEEDAESARPQVAGFVVRESSRMYSNWRAASSLESYLEEAGVVGIEGVDTRMIVRRLRSRGAINGVIGVGDDLADEELVAKAAALPSMAGLDLASGVSTKEAYEWPAPEDVKFRVAALDFGIKRDILRRLAGHGCAVTVLPAGTSAATILDGGFDGVFLSNGPGDPEPLAGPVATIRELLGKVPVFGICLGNQLLGLALGAKTYKLKFGHRGGNHPVLDRETGKVEITAQNHGFCVDFDSLPADVEPGPCAIRRSTEGFGRVAYTHENLNDHTVEGLRCLDVGAFSVQYHPESAPGPHDAQYLFARFADLMRERAAG
jgi:carbamoyl-phosphate synthase small subunit